MARAVPKTALRPYLPADAPVLAAIFEASVAELTAEDYTEAQRTAWAEAAEDVAAFGAELARDLTLVATLEGSPAAFASLRGKDTIRMLYVHPAAAGHGLAASLIDALEKLAAARGAKRLAVEASDTAEGFFAGRGYVARTRITVPRGDEWLGRTRMEKALA